ncbi:MAG: hypothetical protein OK449_06950 [Thaumarchaeota archaeon]|nr:hypothetical protein [Nitrososphaerota archaeon]
MLVKRLAALANILEGLFAAIFALSTHVTGSCGNAMGICPPTSLSDPLAPLLVVGALLLIDGAFCLVEKWPAFLVGILLSLATIVIVAVQWNKIGGLGPESTVITAALALLALALDVKALLSRRPVSEENHPLNLPVFG